MNKIDEKYIEKCNQPSDINQLLPTLKEYADKCDVVIELGVRTCVSIYALLASNTKKVIGYDIERREPEVSECVHLAKECRKDFEFIEADVLKIEIPECDMLFIDTFHSALQLEQELKLHAKKVKKYMLFHDYVTFFERSEALAYAYQSAVDNKVNGDKGLRYAIEPFLEFHSEWEIDKLLNFNNGLLILKRVSL